jgi:hypothetical protein
MSGVKARPLLRPTLASPARREALPTDGARAWVTAEVSRHGHRHVLVVRARPDTSFEAAAWLFEMATERVASVLLEDSLSAKDVEKLRAFLESRDGRLTPCKLEDARAAVLGGLELAGGDVEGAHASLALFE